MQNEQLLHLDSFDGECVMSGSSASSRIMATGGNRVDGEVLQAGNNEHDRRSVDNASSRYQQTNQLPSPVCKYSSVFEMVYFIYLHSSG